MYEQHASARVLDESCQSQFVCYSTPDVDLGLGIFEPVNGAVIPCQIRNLSVQDVEAPKKLDYTKRKEQALRKHLDHISDALASARAAGQAAGAPAGGLGYGDAWPVPVAGQAQVAEKKVSMKKKAVVRNAERPQTPIHEPPPDEDEAHRAATFLQRLLRGRAIQNDMLESAAARDALLTELLQPLRKDLSVGVTVASDEARVANMVASSIRPLLMCAAHPVTTACLDLTIERLMPD